MINNIILLDLVGSSVRNSALIICMLLCFFLTLDDDDDDVDWEFDDNRARLLWIKSLTRLRTQICVNF